jgi:hypothetical protein
MFPAKLIFPENDYSKKIEAFFTMSSSMLNTFEKKDNSKLLKSFNIKNTINNPYVLQGSKSCLLFSNKLFQANTTVCIEDANQRQDIINSFNFLKKCSKKSPKPKKANKAKKSKKANKAKKSKKAIKKQMKKNEFFRVIQDPNQKVYDIPKVRQELIKEFNKKGVTNKQNLNSFYFVLIQ